MPSSLIQTTPTPECARLAYDSGRLSTGAFVPEPSPDLIERAKAGDAEAVDLLIARYLPRLQRWARGRLPLWARDLADTQDLVQEVVFRAFKQIDRFDVRGEGALQGYLRQALMNRIRDEIRRVSRRPGIAELDPGLPDDGPSPVERAIGRQALDRYEQALNRLRSDDREAIVGRIELGMTYQELADALGKPSANAARMAVERALFRLAQEMRPTHRYRS
jgi:RNA polymerase sigma factor (sigma-70 family)